MAIGIAKSDQFTFEADSTRMAEDLRCSLECAEDMLEALEDFHQLMADRKQDSYAVLEVVGFCLLKEAFVWWMDDDSILIVGWQSEDKITLAALPTDAEFIPTPYYEGMVRTLH